MTKPVDLADRYLDEVRAICLPLPEVNEVRTWGHPTFRAGSRTFAVLEDYRGEPTLAFKTGPSEQEAVLADPRFFRTPYIGNKGWVSLRLDRPIDWDQVRELLIRAYRTVALKRMLRALDPR